MHVCYFELNVDSSFLCCRHFLVLKYELMEGGVSNKWNKAKCTMEVAYVEFNVKEEYK